jgi:hypothetical protein
MISYLCILYSIAILSKGRGKGFRHANLPVYTILYSHWGCPEQPGAARTFVPNNTTFVGRPSEVLSLRP